MTVKTKPSQDLHTLLLRAVHQEWPNDPSAPGVVTSYLARDGQFYALARLLDR